MIKRIMLTLSILLLLSAASLADVPQFINFQGNLLDSAGAPVSDEGHLLKFIIWNDPSATDASNMKWNSTFQVIDVSGGLFEYQLGSTVPLPDGLFSNDTILYLGVTEGANPEMLPRTKLVSVAYAFHALRADTADFAASAGSADSSAVVSDNSITSSKIVDGTITESDLGFDPATQTELNTHEGNASAHHTKTTDASELTSGTLPDARLSADIPRKSATNFFTGTQNYFLSEVIVTDADLALRREGKHRWRLRERAGAGLEFFQVYNDANSLQNTTVLEITDNGNVSVINTLSKGAGAFKIDHPLDPENMYLQHSFVESPDMMNVYNGNVELNGSGGAVVILPEYFEVLNRDFRYQLTAIGAPGPNLYIAERIQGNQFRIAGGEPFSEVSWQVTGVRHDKFAELNRIQVEVDKTGHEIGRYLHPKEYGLPIERHVGYEDIKESLKAADEGELEEVN